ncbi:hypothetical protein F5X99DRAFT_412928 [Biscogniauxia marginata]|nr:hypothetical protein F5X99DRAFT_412928 [Biscogniauxia marginata]
MVAQHCQWYGYPRGQGLDIFCVLHVAENIAYLRAGLAHTYQPTEEELAEAYAAIETERQLIRDQRQRGSDDLRANKFPSLSRDTGAMILGHIAAADAEHKLPINLDLKFANDVFNCEWAYIIDLDKETFEVFGGHERKHENHPFKDVGEEDDFVPRHIAEFHLAQLKDMTEDQFMCDISDALRDVGNRMLR